MSETTWISINSTSLLATTVHVLCNTLYMQAEYPLSLTLLLLTVEFFSQIYEHFHAYSRLHWFDHSDLGIIGKIFSSYRTWVQVMLILVKGDDDRSETKANACQGHLRQESMGNFGKCVKYANDMTDDVIHSTQ